MYDFPGASYDAWKTRGPDWDTEDEEEEDMRSRAERYRDDAPIPRRFALIREAQRRAEVNHTAVASRILRRAVEVLGPTYREIHSMDKLKASARKHIAAARAAREFIGPPTPIEYWTW